MVVGVGLMAATGRVGVGVGFSIMESRSDWVSMGAMVGTGVGRVTSLGEEEGQKKYQRARPERMIRTKVRTMYIRFWFTNL